MDTFQLYQMDNVSRPTGRGGSGRSGCFSSRGGSGSSNSSSDLHSSSACSLPCPILRNAGQSFRSPSDLRNGCRSITHSVA